MCHHYKGDTCHHFKGETCHHCKVYTWHDRTSDMATPQGAMCNDYTMTGHLNWHLMDELLNDMWHWRANERLPCGNLPMANIS
jgi:hypothetical protein